MLITVEEYIGMGFPEVDSRNISGCIQRSDYIISALTEGRAEKALQSGGRQAELVKQAAGFQTYQLLREMELIDGSGDSSSGSEKVTIGDYSYSTQTSRGSTANTFTADCDDAGLNTIRLLRAAGCMFAGVEVRE